MNIMDTIEPRYYWHFISVDDTGTPHLGHGDGREVKIGDTLTVDGEPQLCKHGLHASAKLCDATGWAESGNQVLCRVTLGGTVLDGGDKSVANERTVLAILDADAIEKLLRDWGRWCALQVIHMWDAPYVVHQYLETGDESLRSAARDATLSSGRATDRVRARDAAWSAAFAATIDSAMFAAFSAARDSVAAIALSTRWKFARAARGKAAIDKYTAELERRALAAIAKVQESV
jgi:hypothetical protein